MIPIAVSQRVDINLDYNERRDALDQRWFEFFTLCNLMPILIPNHLATAKKYIELNIFDGILFTGGNAVPGTDGCAKERDEVERLLFQHAIDTNKPILGVCHGMQVIQHYFDVPLQLVNGHVTPKQTILIENKRRDVNSYHDWGTTETTPELEIWARSDDEIVKAVRHISYPITGIMWHPERFRTFQNEDIQLFKDTFGVH